MTEENVPPVTGAWRVGDEVGDRKFFHGTRVAGLDEFTLAYETWGTLNADHSNAVLVCHAFTGDSHAYGDKGSGHPTGGWWKDVIGPGCAIDTNKYFVVCSNVLGGCQGSTGPSSTNPKTGRPYGSEFPRIQISDIVRAQEQLQRHLGIDQWLSVVGGSMGGYQVLDWATHFPRKLRSIVPLSTCIRSTHAQLLVQAAGREMVERDPGFYGGDYYNARLNDGPFRGLGLARIGDMKHYRTQEEFETRFDGQADLSGYLQHHARKIAGRFDANSYLVLSRAMDDYDIGNDFRSQEDAFDRIDAAVLVVGNSQDTLYPIELQEALHDSLMVHGNPRQISFAYMDSITGHDAFLAAPDQVSEAVGPFLDRQFELTTQVCPIISPLASVTPVSIG